MRSIKAVLVLLVVTLLFTSCKENTGENDESNNAVQIEQSSEVDLKRIALNIEGMTCEIGCARTIQSKLSKTEGVKFAEIHFEKKNGIVEYDANKVSEKEIVNVVEQIAGGDLYKVTDIEKAE